MQSYSFHGNTSFRSSPIAHAMYGDRTTEFIGKKGWKLQTNQSGGECDTYDYLSPFYLVVGDSNRSHIASARLMPLSGPTMSADIFGDLFPDTALRSKDTWEVSRFFGACKAGRQALQCLMAAGVEFGLARGVRHYVGIAGEQMIRVYKMLGWPPEVLSYGTCDDGDIAACRWVVSAEILENLRSKRHNNFRPLIEEDASSPAHTAA